MAQTETFDSWGVLELMGHVRTAGRITEEQRFGATLGRCDVPQEDGGFVTIYFGGGSVYRLTPCSEEAARAVARSNKPEPVHTWEMPKPKATLEDMRGMAAALNANSVPFGGPHDNEDDTIDEDDSEEMGF